MECKPIPNALFNGECVENSELNFPELRNAYHKEFDSIRREISACWYLPGKDEYGIPIPHESIVSISTVYLNKYLRARRLKEKLNQFDRDIRLISANIYSFLLSAKDQHAIKSNLSSFEKSKSRLLTFQFDRQYLSENKDFVSIQMHDAAHRSAEIIYAETRGRYSALVPEMDKVYNTEDWRIFVIP